MITVRTTEIAANLLFFRLILHDFLLFIQCTYVHTHSHTHTHTYTNTFTHSLTNVHTHTRTHIHAHTHTRTRTHRHSSGTLPPPRGEHIQQLKEQMQPCLSTELFGQMFSRRLQEPPQGSIYTHKGRIIIIYYIHIDLYTCIEQHCC